MARVAIAVSQAPGAGSGTVTWTAANIADGHTLANDGETVLVVRNPDAAQAVTVTIVSVPCSHGRVGDIVQAVAVETTRVFGPFPKEMFNQPSGVVHVDLAGTVTGVQLAGVRGRPF